MLVKPHSQPDIDLAFRHARSLNFRAGKRFWFQGHWYIVKMDDGGRFVRLANDEATPERCPGIWSDGTPCEESSLCHTHQLALNKAQRVATARMIPDGRHFFAYHGQAQYHFRIENGKVVFDTPPPQTPRKTPPARECDHAPVDMPVRRRYGDQERPDFYGREGRVPATQNLALKPH